MAQGNMGTYSIGVIADFSSFNQAVLNATQTLTTQTQLMTNMLNTMNVNASKSMSQMAASMGTGIKEAASGVTTAFQNMANNANQSSKSIASSTQQTAASLTNLQSSMNHVNTQGMANATGNLTQQHGQLRTALANTANQAGILGNVFGKLKSHLEFMASGAMIAGLIGIPTMIIKTATETETLTQKMRQNLELADQYHNNNQLLNADLNRLNDAAGKFAIGFGVGLPDVMESMQILSRRFKDVESISYLTSVALTMNKLDFVDLGSATKNLEAVMLQFDLSAQGTKQFLNDFSVACHVANIKGSDLMDALQRSGSAFKGFNMGSREAIAAVSALSTETARTGSTIGNTMKSITANFSMDKAIAALDSYNIKLYDVSENGMKTMRDGANVFAELQNLYAKLDDEGKSKLALAIAGGKYQVNAMQAFLADANSNFSKIMGELKTKSSDEMTQELLKTGMETFATNMGQLKAALQVFAQTMGNQVLPYLKQFAVYMTGSVMWLKLHSDSVTNVVGVLGDLLLAYAAIKAAALTYAAATTLVSIYTGLQAIATAGLTGTMALATAGTWAQNAANVAATASTFLSIAATEGLAAAFVALDVAISPVLLLTAAILALAAVAYVLYNYWSPILQWMKDTWNQVVNFIANNIGMIMILFPPLGAAILLISVAWEPVVNFIKSLWNGLVSFLQGISKVFIAIFEGMCTAFPLFVDAAKTGISNFASAIGDVVRSILPAWGNDVIDFFISLGNKIAGVTANIGATIRKNLTIGGINADGGVGDVAYGPQNKEKSPFEKAMEQAKSAYEQMVTNNTIPGAGPPTTPEISNQIHGKEGKGKTDTGDTEYQIAKKSFEAANSKAEYKKESSGNEYTAADKLALYQQHMSGVTKIDDAHHQETLDYAKGEYDIKKKINDQKIALEEASLNREIVLTKISAEKKAEIESEIARKKENNIPLTVDESKVDIAFQKINNELSGSVAQMNARIAAINAENELLNNQYKIVKAEADLNKEIATIRKTMQMKNVANEVKNKQLTEPQKNAREAEEAKTQYTANVDGVKEKLQANATDPKLQAELYEQYMSAVTEADQKTLLKKMEDNSRDKVSTITTINEGWQAWSSYYSKLQALAQKDYQYQHRYLLAFTNTLQSGISSGLQAILQRTQSFGQAMRSVFNSLAKSISTQWTTELSQKWTSILTKMLQKSKTTNLQKLQNDKATDSSSLANKTATDAAELAKEQIKIEQEKLLNNKKNQLKKTSDTNASTQAVASIGTEMVAMLEMMAIMYALSALFGGSGSSTSSSTTSRSSSSYYGSGVATTSLPSYDVGTLDVPHDMLAQIHKGEVVIPAAFADGARDFISSGGFSGNSNATANQQFSVPKISHSPTYNVTAMDGKGVGKVLQNNSRDVTQGLYKVNRSLAMQNVSKWGRP